MIELTPEQRQAIEQGQPVRVIDRTTLDTYVRVQSHSVVTQLCAQLHGWIDFVALAE